MLPAKLSKMKKQIWCQERWLNKWSVYWLYWLFHNSGELVYLNLGLELKGKVQITPREIFFFIIYLFQIHIVYPGPQVFSQIMKKRQVKIKMNINTSERLIMTDEIEVLNFQVITINKRKIPSCTTVLSYEILSLTFIHSWSQEIPCLHRLASQIALWAMR